MTASPRDLRAAGTCDRAQEGLENEDGYYLCGLSDDDRCFELFLARLGPCFKIRLNLSF